jgi:hypothetical protein
VQIQGWWSQEKEDEARSSYRLLSRQLVAHALCFFAYQTAILHVSPANLNCELRAAILKALSDAEALKKPSVSSLARDITCASPPSAFAFAVSVVLPLSSDLREQVKHLFADVLDEKTEILKQQEKQMLQHMAKYSQHYNVNLYEQ